jgi:hypothetical protein
LQSSPNITNAPFASLYFENYRRANKNRKPKTFQTALYRHPAASIQTPQSNNAHLLGDRRSQSLMAL